MIQCDAIAEIAQALVAVLIVGGGGLAALLGSPHTTEILPFMAIVIGYYFGRSVNRGKPGNGESKGNGNA